LALRDASAVAEGAGVETVPERHTRGRSVARVRLRLAGSGECSALAVAADGGAARGAATGGAAAGGAAAGGAAGGGAAAHAIVAGGGAGAGAHGTIAVGGGVVLHLCRQRRAVEAAHLAAPAAASVDAVGEIAALEIVEAVVRLG